MKLTGLAAALGSAMGARLGMAVLNYGLFWVLSHQLAPAELGGFSLLMSIFLLLQYLPMLGLSVPLIRRTAMDRAGSAVETSNAIAFALPVAMLMAVAVALSGRLGYDEALHLPFLLVGLAMLPNAWITVGESVLLGSERVSDMSRIQFAEAFLRAGLCLVAVHLGGGLTGVFAVFFAVRIVMALAYYLHPLVPRPRLALVQGELQRRNRAEVPVFLGMALLVALGARLDVIVLSRLTDMHEVGVYASASRLYEAAQLVPTLTVMVLLPSLSRLFTSEPDRFGEVLALALRACLGFGLPIALAVAACAEPLIGLLYPPDMAGAAAVLRWLIFAAVLMTVDQLLSATMIAAQAQSQDLRSLIWGAVALVTGLVLLAPAFGPLGAAMAVTLGLLVRVLVRLRWATRTLALPRVWGDLTRLALATGVGVAGLALALTLTRSIGYTAPLGLLAAVLAFALTARVLGLVGPDPLGDARAGFARLTGRAV